MTQIWIVRHGEAAASWEKDPDPGLSALGQSQAEETATALLDIVPVGTHLISSPLRRAQETAAAFAVKRGDDVRVDPRFSEVRSPVPLIGLQVYPANASFHELKLEDGELSLVQLGQQMETRIN
jgi:hypothetical protein